MASLNGQILTEQAKLIAERRNLIDYDKYQVIRIPDTHEPMFRVEEINS